MSTDNPKRFSKSDYKPLPLSAYPPIEKWDDWVEYDAAAWPKKVENRYTLVPTICFNCEAACGLLAYINKDTMEIRKFEGNPEHPGSRGRNCAKGPATINQVNDPERILYPLKRVGKRGDGGWERVSWDDVLDDLAAKIRKTIEEDRHNEIMYHVGRPGSDGYMYRVMQAWGIDGHNTHTTVCSGAARVGYSLWMGDDRPSPDFANAKFILLLSAHLETGHYFNPHAQRIMEGKMDGAKIAAVDIRLSNTASVADYWIAPWPGTESAMLLSFAHVILNEGLYDAEFMKRWVNWDEYMKAMHPDTESTFDNFIAELKKLYASYTPEFAEEECNVKAATIIEVAREIGKAGSAFASHVWRNAAAGNLGGWQVSRCLQFLNVLVGSVGTPGGVSPNSWDKFVPPPFMNGPQLERWNELLFPKDYPLAHYEMSFLLPHLIKEGRGKLSVYFTRVYNPVWTNPDGMSWVEMLRDEEQVGVHAVLSPTWNETALFADYVLPMGVASERHDLMSQETQAGAWIGFRQPVLKTAREKQGETFEFTYEANPGEVWEEDEFWIELSWRIDPDGSLGIRKYFESPYHPGEKVTVDEYYQWIFENSVPGLPEAAAEKGLKPLEYMRKFGAFEVKRDVYSLYEGSVNTEQSSVDPDTQIIKDANNHAIGINIEGKSIAGFKTPSRKLEFYSKTMGEWKWEDQSVPGYIRSHVHWRNLNQDKGEYILVPTFRLPTLIHTRSGNSKWLYETAHRNPLWLRPEIAEKFGVKTGDLIRICTEIGYFVPRVWITEGVRPGVVACSHHFGRWRLQKDGGGERLSTALVDLNEQEQGKWFMRQLQGIEPFKSDDPETERIWWRDAGVHQNLTFPVHPDPISGMHCWHQKITIENVRPEDQYGDVYVDTNKSHEVYKEWLKMTKPAPGPDGLRRPLELQRPLKPTRAAYQLEPEE